MSAPPGGPPRIAIRPARAADVGPLRAFKRQIFSETELLLLGPEDWEDDHLAEVGLIGSFEAHDRSVLLLAFEGREVVGMCTVVAGALVRNRHVGQLGMGVLRRCWRRGVGAAMMAWAVDWARDQAGLHKLSLQVHEHNDGARRLYEKLGFAYEGVLRDEALCGGRYVDLLAMGRILR